MVMIFMSGEVITTWYKNLWYIFIAQIQIDLLAYERGDLYADLKRSPFSLLKLKTEYNRFSIRTLLDMRNRRGQEKTARIQEYN